MDPRSENGAFMVAWAAHWAASRGVAEVDGVQFLESLRRHLPNEDFELLSLLNLMEHHAKSFAALSAFAGALGVRKGVSGYIYQTVPIALYSWLHSPGDFREAVEGVIALGGDTDSTGAIAGALVGATIGESGIPSAWLSHLFEWPRSVTWMRQLGYKLAEVYSENPANTPAKPLPLFWPALLPRNLLFLLTVLVHGLRRLLPPY
jgi:ADP-ribosylglycohydrolase